MDPRQLFPLLSLAFALLAVWRFSRTRQWRGAVGTWLLLAVAFGVVSLWLQWQAT